MYSSTILLVQPDTTSGLALRNRLEHKGYTVVETANTATAMNIVNGSEIGLVVTELYLPFGESRCLASAIAEVPALRRTKLLAYTTHGKRRDRQWARRIGADGYVITRSGEDRLLDVVDHLMGAASTPRRSTSGPRRIR
jgi:DNA-binding NarL/FixJ family response regulator